MASTKAKVAAAFHEVKENPPKVLAKTRRKSGAALANRQRVAIALSKARKAGASIPDASGANFVSQNDLHIPAGVTGQGKDTWKRGSERVAPSGQEASFKNPQDLHNYPTNDQYRSDRFPSLHLGQAQIDHQLDMMTVKRIERKMNPVEQVRQRNNQARDSRTNLGRGKAGMPVAEEENGVQEAR